MIGDSDIDVEAGEMRLQNRSLAGDEVGKGVVNLLRSLLAAQLLAFQL